MHDFSYHAPTGLDEALGLLSATPQARVLAGGTDLYLALEHPAPGAAQPPALVDLKRIPELSALEETPGGGLRLGALVCMATLERDPRILARYPALAAGASAVGGPPIRNRATLGGNLCNASPAADTSPPLLALDARVVLRGAQGERELPLAELWAGPRRTTLAPGELLSAVLLPPWPGRSGNAFTRLTRSAMDIAVVNAAAALTLDEAGRLTALRVALGAVGPTVLAVPELDALLGQTPDDALLAELRHRAEGAARPIDDLRASAPYRREMAAVLAVRAVQGAVSHAKQAARSAPHSTGAAR